MKRKSTLLVFLFLALVVMLSGCSENENLKELDPAFDKELLKQKAEQVVDDWNHQNFEAITSQSDDSIKDGLTPELLKQGQDSILEKLGAFKKIEKTKIVTRENGQATVTIVAEYEKSKLQHLVTYNTHMKITGYWIR
ncbi:MULTISPECIES: DUF3887 domain-containing protein [Eubacterium]|uniref:DUF3887 domain-containing protein n=1 Tax=Eubacterium maltosivorans TaxID=2041044 RepID=A0A4P9C4D5_EUBML|nr:MULTISPECIES: DUF3887 domain-containing protein [Eubacterium]MDO5432743.1 DUF3887 domain-containing protein [Eubacterium sp.]QCT70153.1 DUF3887 domain-containing protein [Eubacterium maltosivorans]